MSRKSRVIGIALSGILFAIIAAGFAAFVYFNPIPTVQAAPPADEPYVDPQAPDTWVWRSSNCLIGDIFVTAGRAHVRCTTAEPVGVFYYALYGDAAHQTYTNRALVLLNTAYALNKPVYITYDTDTSANPPGCNTSDCRALVQILIRP